MSRRLPALRSGLDIVPSPDPNRPGLLLRDPLRYTDKVIFVPPPWTVGLRFLDGEHTELDMQEALRERRASWSSATLNLSLRGGWRIPTITGNAARPL